jgi:hypothetical protein
LILSFFLFFLLCAYDTWKRSGGFLVVIRGRSENESSKKQRKKKNKQKQDQSTVFMNLRCNSKDRASGIRGAGYCWLLRIRRTSKLNVL